jgi:hypothetical protein
MRKNLNPQDNPSEEQLARNSMVREMLKHIGRPYQYGGETDSDYGIDCSGLAKRCLYAGGFNLGGDMNAQMIYNYFKGCTIPLKDVKEGDLYFYGTTPKNVVHVCLCFRVWDTQKNYRMIVGANSGSPNTLNIDKAWSAKAFVKVEIDTYWRSNLLATINPFLKN